MFIQRSLFALLASFIVAAAAAQNLPKDSKEPAQLPAVQKPKAGTALTAAQAPEGAKMPAQAPSVPSPKNPNVMAPTGAGVATPPPTAPATIPVTLPDKSGLSPGAAAMPGIKPAIPAAKLPEAGLAPGQSPMRHGFAPLPTPRAGTPPPEPELRYPTAIMQRNYPAGTRFTTDRGTWHCEGNRCESRNLDLRDFFTACSFLAQPAGPVVSMRSRELQLNAAEIERCNSPRVEEFHITACSGADDFRVNSSLKLSWDAGGGFFPEQGQPLDFIGGKIDANNCNYARIPGYGVRRFFLTDLRALRFTFTGGRRTFTDAQDDWDLRRISVQVKVSRPGDPPINMNILTQEGSPLHHFDNAGQWQVEMPRR